MDIFIAWAKRQYHFPQTFPGFFFVVVVVKSQKTVLRDFLRTFCECVMGLFQGVLLSCY